MAKVAEAPQLYKQSMDEFFKMAKYPLVKQCDMSGEMKEEAVDVCITAVEKFPQEREKCTQVLTLPSQMLTGLLAAQTSDCCSLRCHLSQRRSILGELACSMQQSTHAESIGTPLSQFGQRAVQLIKDTMDKKFGPAWQVVVGKGFSYDVQHEVPHVCVHMLSLHMTREPSHARLMRASKQASALLSLCTLLNPWACGARPRGIFARVSNSMC
jgi:Dynein light chain type 1